MSFWRRLKSRIAGEPAASAEPEPVTREPSPRIAESPDANEQPAVAPAEPRPAVAEPKLELLPRLAAGERVELGRALAELGAARSTRRERAALAAVVQAHAAGHAPEALRTAAAELFAARGQREDALALLEAANGTAALLLAADLEAERGRLARAVTLAERVLARDLDTPGARERHRRWRASLGRPEADSVHLSTPTLLRAEPPDTPLRIVGEAGRGGAGVVYEAIDDRLGRRVALKVYHRPEEDRDKLEREARTAVELAGSGVVRVFEADVTRGWIVMEWLGGGALAQWLRRRDRELPLPLGPWLPALVEALARIHGAGIVHGDLKPANVMFRSATELVLGDFGLARRVGEPLAGGSRGYLSPERLAGEPASFGDDLYAVGRVLEDVLEAVEPGAEDAAAHPAARSLVARLLGPAPARPSAPELRELLAGRP